MLGLLFCSHREISIKIENTGKRALLAAHTSYELLQELLEGKVAQRIRQELEDR